MQDSYFFHQSYLDKKDKIDKIDKILVENPFFFL